MCKCVIQQIVACGKIPVSGSDDVNGFAYDDQSTTRQPNIEQSFTKPLIENGDDDDNNVEHSILAARRSKQTNLNVLHAAAAAAGRVADFCHGTLSRMLGAPLLLCFSSIDTGWGGKQKSA